MFKLIGLMLTATLAACQTTAPGHYPAPVDPIPPVVRGENAQMPVAPPAAASRPQSSAVITVHLAQQRQEPSLIPVDAGGDAPLYALPQPVLTQGDIARVSPVTAQDRKTFLLLEMNQYGIAKLRNVTEQARGNFLLLSVQGQLVSVAKIGEVISDGRLLVSTQGPAHTQAIIRLMQNR
ncbi:hypothetical protein H0A62_05030 [Pusillimonas harenae]|uniref:Pilus assembly protein PilP n=2 Tax=Pollutimonas harenae TaxID=657015 RepID=A0A853GS00_9BURK|nr:hypothetical protein [Pollutimonas harenae]TEA73628.1 hypothetical protein ERD84_01700 [Pollutimonas harenae]